MSKQINEQKKTLSHLYVDMPSSNVKDPTLVESDDDWEMISISLLFDNDSRYILCLFYVYDSKYIYSYYLFEENTK